MNRRSRQLFAVFLGIVVLLAVLLVFLRWGQRGDESMAERDKMADAGMMERGGNATAKSPTPVVTPRPPTVETSRSLAVRGRVSSEEGDLPIEGARIRAFIDANRKYDNPAFELTSDGSGQFSLFIPEGSLPTTSLIVAVAAQGFASDIRNVYTANGRLPREPIEADFRLKPAGSVIGQVVNGAGEPVAEATVGLYRRIEFSGLRFDDPNEVFPSVATNGEGRFELTDLPVGDAMRLIASKDGYLPGMVENVYTNAEQAKIIIRKGEARIKGYVFDEGGEPVASLPVRVVHMGKGVQPDMRYSRGAPNMNEVFARTSDTGYYEFPAVLSGWAGVVAGYGMPVSRSAGEAVFLEPGDEKTVNLKFQPAIGIKGVTVDAKTGAPVAGVRLTNLPNRSDIPRIYEGAGGGSGRQEAVTDFDGKFALSVDSTVETQLGMPMSIFYLAPSPYSESLDDWLERRIGARELGENQEIRVELDTPMLTKGVVLMPDGSTPAPGVPVFFPFNVEQIDMAMPERSPEAVTNAQGQFEFIARPGSRGFIGAVKSDAIATLAYEVPEEPAAEPLRIVLEYTGSVTGRVTFADGSAVPGVTLSATPMMGRRAGWMGRLQAETNLEGVYTFDRLIAMEYFITVTPPESMRRPEPQRIDLEPSEPLSGVDFVIPDSISFEGVVLNADEEPIPGVVVERGRFNPARRFGAASGPSIETNQQGHFMFDTLSAEDGIYSFTFVHPMYETKSVEDLLPEESPITVVLERRPRLEFTVQEEGGAQITSFEYTLVGEDAGWNSGERNRTARSIYSQTEPVAETLSSGNYELHVYELDAAGGKTGRYGFKAVELGRTAEKTVVVVEIEGEVKLSGVVVTADDEPIPDARVELVYPDLRRAGRGAWPVNTRLDTMRETGTDGEGRFSFEGLVKGAVRVAASVDGLVQTEDVSLELESGEEVTDVKIVMAGGAIVFGLVTGVDGDPMAGARISVGGGRDGEFVTDDSGTYRVENIEPGRYDVTVRSTNRALLAAERIEVTVGEEKEQNFDFSDRVYLYGEISVTGSSRDPRPGIVLRPKRPGQPDAMLSPNRGGTYEAVLYPGEYDLYTTSPGGNVSVNTGMSFDLPGSPATRMQNFTLRLETIDVIIVTADETASVGPGQFTYEHRNDDGQLSKSSFRWNRNKFAIDNQPHGQCRAEFRAENGAVYLSDWIDISEGSEKILTLVPEQYFGG